MVRTASTEHAGPTIVCYATLRNTIAYHIVWLHSVFYYSISYHIISYYVAGPHGGQATAYLACTRASTYDMHGISVSVSVSISVNYLYY